MNIQSGCILYSRYPKNTLCLQKERKYVKLLMVVFDEGIIPHHLYHPSPCHYKDPIFTITALLSV